MQQIFRGYCSPLPGHGDPDTGSGFYEPHLRKAGTGTDIGIILFNATTVQDCRNPHPVSGYSVGIT